ncbi:TMEM175 family protein [Verrucomicrobiota bacterium sgz303538]
MKTGRLEAFSDGVLAIIITIMVLELKVPHGTDFAALAPLAPVVLSYVLSFIYVGIYWNNHHHLFQAAERVNGAILWANLHILFWLSLIPFVTGWMGENHFTALPTALYGVVLFMAAVAWLILQSAIIAEHGRDSRIAAALGPDWKGKLSWALYLAAIGLSFVQAWIACALYALVAALWFIPDRRFARAAGADVEK